MWYNRPTVIPPSPPERSWPLRNALLDGATAGWTTSHLFCVYRSSLKDPLFYLRLFGHVLGHADLDHFLNNMLLFLVIGPPMEEKYGSIPLLKAIVLTALVSGVLQCLLFPGVALLGASGIVFMLIMLWRPSTWGTRSTPSCSCGTTLPTSCTSWAACAAPLSGFTAPMPARAGKENTEKHAAFPGIKSYLSGTKSRLPAGIRALWPKFARRPAAKS